MFSWKRKHLTDHEDSWQCNTEAGLTSSSILEVLACMEGKSIRTSCR
jgi:hypothetical protein